MGHIDSPDIVRTVYSSIFRYIQGYPAIFSHVQAYWGTLRHIQAYSGIVKKYWAIFRTLCNPCIYNRVIFRIMSHLEHETSSKAFRTCKMTKHIQSPGIVRSLSKHLQGYLEIFRDSHAYWSTLKGVQLGRRGADLSCPFLKMEKNALIWEKKFLIVSIFGLNFPFKKPLIV